MKCTILALCHWQLALSAVQITVDVHSSNLRLYVDTLIVLQSMVYETIVRSSVFVHYVTAVYSGFAAECCAGGRYRLTAAILGSYQQRCHCMDCSMNASSVMFTAVVVSWTHTHTHPFNGPLSGTTQVSRYQKGKTNLDFIGAKRQWGAVASAGPYANLHIAPDK